MALLQFNLTHLIIKNDPVFPSLHIDNFILGFPFLARIDDILESGIMIYFKDTILLDL
jgi:hypothetical protein